MSSKQPYTPEQLRAMQERQKRQNERDSKLIKIVMISLGAGVAILFMLGIVAYLLEPIEQPAPEPVQVPIGMELDTFKTRVNAYSALRDNNIWLAGESLGYKDGYYSACYLLGGSATVTVHLTDEESQQIHDIEILALNETEEEITRYVVYLAAFNKALVDDECLDEINAIADFMRKFDTNAGAESIGDIELYTYFPKTSDGKLAGYAQVTYKRFTQAD